MSQRSKLLVSCLLAVGILTLAVPLAVAQSAIEQAATQQIANETGIDEDELATLFVSDGPDEYIISFIYISEETLQSDLRQDLKDEVAPFVDRDAMLTLVVPTRTSNFNPTEIAFQQNDVTHLLAINQIHAISDDFFSGRLQSREVSSGIIELPQTLNFEEQFDIVFRGEYSTPFAIGVEVVQEQQQSSGGFFGNALLSFITFLITILLIPFLIFI